MFKIRYKQKTSRVKNRRFLLTLPVKIFKIPLKASFWVSEQLATDPPNTETIAVLFGQENDFTDFAEFFGDDEPLKIWK